MMYKSIVGLKIGSSASLAKSISIIRKYQPVSMGEIKDKILTHEYVLVYSRINDKGVKDVIHCYEELVNADIPAELYEGNNEPTTIDLLKNLDKTYDEISVEIDAEDEEL